MEEVKMKTRKLTTIVSLLAFGFFATSVLAEAPAAPSNIDPNNHRALAAYYEGLAKEVAERLEHYQHELQDYEDHPYAYGRQGQDLNSHLHANIREYSKELTEDLEQAELHKKMSSTQEGGQLNKLKAQVNLDGSVVR